MTDTEWDAMTVDQLRQLETTPPLDADGFVDEPGNPIDGCEYKQCWGARETVERELAERAAPKMLDCWWAS